MGEKNQSNFYLFFLALTWTIIILAEEILRDIVNVDALLKFICAETLIIFIMIIFILIKQYRTVFRILTLFVIMYFIYLQGQVLLNVFNLTTNGLLSGKFSNSELIGGILDVHLFMAMFLFGVSTSHTYFQRPQEESGFFRISQLYDKNMITVGMIIIACSLPFELYVNLQKVFFSLTYGYASLYQESALNSISSSAKILSYFFAPGCYYVFFASERKSWSERISLLLLAFHSITELAIGYRASAMIPIILILYGLTLKSRYVNSAFLSRKTKKIIIRASIIAFLVVIFVFPVVRQSRNSGGLIGITASDYFSIDNYRELFTTVNDMGKSLQTIIYTKQIVPVKEGFRYGISYLMNLTTVIPNLFWARHPAEVYGSLGKWLTKIVDYSFWQFGGALGFSCVAEAYVNFGYIGIVAMGFLLGRVLQTVENKIEASGRAINYASYAIVATYLLSYSRGEFSDLVRGIFWYMLIPRIFYKVVTNQKEKGNV